MRYDGCSVVVVVMLFLLKISLDNLTLLAFNNNNMILMIANILFSGILLLFNNYNALSILFYFMNFNTCLLVVLFRFIGIGVGSQ